MKKKKEVTINPELEWKLRSHLLKKEPLFGDESPFSELLQGMVNKMLEGEVDHHLKEEKIKGKANKRNGYTNKQVLTESGPIEVSTPRDRLGSFEPELIAKRQTHLSSGLDRQILALYAQGNSIEDVRRLLKEFYSVDISAGKISQITDQVIPQLESWRNRGLGSFYPIVYLDAVHFKVREDGRYINQAFYTVYSVNWEGQRDLLGMYINKSEGANRWGLILQDLKRRGVEDILIFCVDDLKGFSRVIQEEYPESIVQKCIVHQVRNSLKYVDEKDRKKVASDLRKIYTSVTVEQAQSALESFDRKWTNKYDYITKQWREKWSELTAFFDFESPIRRMIYTTNPVEALHRVIRKLIKAKAAWVSQTALMKQMFLSLRQNEKSWKKKAYDWKVIQRELLKMYPNRIYKYTNLKQ